MIKHKLSGLLCLLIALSAGIFTLSSAEEEATDKKDSVKALQDEFLKLKFGMFLYYNNRDQTLSRGEQDAVRNMLVPGAELVLEQEVPPEKGAGYRSSNRDSEQ
jgi:hypothetical protein